MSHITSIPREIRIQGPEYAVFSHKTERKQILSTVDYGPGLTHKRTIHYEPGLTHKRTIHYEPGLTHKRTMHYGPGLKHKRTMHYGPGLTHKRTMHYGPDLTHKRMNQATLYLINYNSIKVHVSHVKYMCFIRYI